MAAALLGVSHEGSCVAFSIRPSRKTAGAAAEVDFSTT
jgi:hypothetical protein